MTAAPATRELIDFAGLMPSVAAALLGEPNPRLSRGARLRFGAKGSMEVDTGEGWFDDHEAAVRGGVLDLIRHKAGVDRAGALRWLEENGFKDCHHGNTFGAERVAPANDAAPRAFYDYHDEAGAVLFRVERRGKDAVPPFLQHGPDGRGGFHARQGCMQGVPRVVYRLPKLSVAPSGELIYFCEGEKDADRLTSLGLVATTNPGGASKFTAAMAGPLAGRRVIVLQDNDAPGAAHVAAVLKVLAGIADDAVPLLLPGLPPKGDVSDWLDAGGTVDELRGLAEVAIERGEKGLTFPIADLAAWSLTSAAPTPFYMAGHIPANEVTLLTGAGGSNKSTFGQQLATCSAAALDMLGVPVMRGPALYITAEDHEDRLHWMQEHICRALGIDMASLAGKLFLASIRGRLNNELATFDADGRIQPRETFQLLRSTFQATGARLLVLDNVAHLFAGNENDRGQVTAFVNLLYSLCRDFGVTILLIAHVNKAGDSYSGSTAWLNAVRSQLMLGRPENGVDPDARVLSIGKANYARPDQQLAFRWHDFALVRDQDLPADTREAIAAVVAVNADNAAFLACLDARARDGLIVSPNVSPNYAPSQFEAMPAANGVGRDRLRKAMERLLAIGEIEVFDHENKGKGRNVKALRRPSRTSPDGFPDGSRTGFPHVPGQSARTSPDGPRTHTHTTYGAGAALEPAPPPSVATTETAQAASAAGWKHGNPALRTDDGDDWSTGWGEGP